MQGESNQVNQPDTKKHLRQYYILGGSLLLTGLALGLVIYFWDTIQGAAAYGYAGCFFSTAVAGMTIWPGPGLLVVFSLGHKLNPILAGMAGGLGEAIGGIAIYLTGSGSGSVWSHLRHKKQAANASQSTQADDSPKPEGIQKKSWWASLIDRISAPVQRWRGGWPVFIASAVVFSPFYLIALGAGAAKMSLKRYFLLSWAGKTIKCLYVALAGYWGLQAVFRWLGG
jgi:membrane protein YqaA with SNARE-associated domain